MGGKKGYKESGVKGKRIGYMNKDMYLNIELKIREKLLYFGWVNGMKSEEINEKLNLMMKLIKIKKKDSLIKNISGGKKRRI